jgi:prolyl 4-hydroxylase
MEKNLFLETYFIDEDICDRLIKMFHDHPRMDPNAKPMYFAKGKHVEADPNIKQSTDLSVTMDDSLKYPVVVDYLEALQDCIDSYTEKWPTCNWYAPWKITSPINLQYYKPTEAYHGWHTERCSTNDISISRHLVFMTYLNTVTDQGGTEFYNQKLTINAEKGKTVIWPADWTFTHRGVPSPTQEKYIITGWFNYIDD